MGLPGDGTHSFRHRGHTRRQKHVFLFGDLTGWFYALDAATDEQLWKKRPEVDEAVRLSGVPVVYNDMVLIPVASWEESRAVNLEYPCCTFRGSITALRIKDGSEVWKTYTIPRKAELSGKTSVGTPPMSFLARVYV